MTRTPEQILCCPRGCIMPANECCAVTRSNQTAGNGTQHFSVLMQMPLPDRLTVARALVPDGWVEVRDRNASAAHATRATDLWLVTEERDNLRAGTDRLIAERTSLRARVDALEAALIPFARYSKKFPEADANVPLTVFVSDIPRMGDCHAARAALEGKP